MKKVSNRRVLMSLIGVIVLGFSVGICRFAAFGVDPFTSFMVGMDHMSTIPYGVLYIIVNVVLLVFALCFDRHYIGIATFINIFLLGYITDFTYSSLRLLIGNSTIIVRVLFLLVGLLLFCISSSLYMTADLGVSTYDAIALIMANKWHIWEFKYLRIVTDIACIILGAVIFLLSGGEPKQIVTFISVGTVITAFFTGPMIEFFNNKISRRILSE